MSRCSIAILCALALAACTDLDEDASSGDIDVRVVIQETNLPPLPCRDGEASYVAELDRACDGQRVELSVCSPAPLCDARRAWLTDAAIACDLDSGPIDVAELPACSP